MSFQFVTGIERGKDANLGIGAGDDLGERLARDARVGIDHSDDVTRVTLDDLGEDADAEGTKANLEDSLHGRVYTGGGGSSDVECGG